MQRYSTSLSALTESAAAALVAMAGCTYNPSSLSLQHCDAGEQCPPVQFCHSELHVCLFCDQDCTLLANAAETACVASAMGNGSSGSCVIRSCVSGWQDADNLVATGCEALVPVVAPPNDDLDDVLSDELCDGVDNDGDGVVDEGFALGVACDGPDSDQCLNGVTVCNQATDGVTCGPESQNDIAELCDGIDNDCSGTVDDNLPTPPMCDSDQGVCAGHYKVCDGANQWTGCDAEYREAFESTPDGLDNDCDGVVDNGFVYAPLNTPAAEIPILGYWPHIGSGIPGMSTDGGAVGDSDASGNTKAVVVWLDNESYGHVQVRRVLPTTASSVLIDGDASYYLEAVDGEPCLTWSGSVFGIGYVKKNPSTGQPELRFMTYDPSATSGSPSILIASNANSCDVVWNGASFALVWRRTDVNGFGLALVQPSLDVASAATPIRTSESVFATEEVRHPSLVKAAGETYGLAWSTTLNGRRFIRFALLPSVPLSTWSSVSPITVSHNEYGGAYHPSLVRAGTEFGLIWDDKRASATDGSRRDIYFARIRADGSLINEQSVAVLHEVASCDWEMAPRLVFSRGMYAFIARAQKNGGNYIVFARMRPDGSLEGPAGGAPENSLVWLGNGSAQRGSDIAVVGSEFWVPIADTYGGNQVVIERLSFPATPTNPAP